MTRIIGGFWALFVGLVVSLLVAIAVGVPTAQAQTTTSQDQYYFFQFSNWGDTDCSSPAPKEDASPVYVLVNHMTLYDVYLFVEAYDYSTGSWTNQTIGTFAYLVDPGDWGIRTTVYESGYVMTRLCGLANGAGQLGNWWSPDSAYAHPLLN